MLIPGFYGQYLSSLPHYNTSKEGIRVLHISLVGKIFVQKKYLTADSFTYLTKVMNKEKNLNDRMNC